MAVDAAAAEADSDAAAAAVAKGLARAGGELRLSGGYCVRGPGVAATVPDGMNCSWGRWD